MLEKFKNLFINFFYRKNKYSQPIKLAIFLIIISPIIFLSYLHYTETEEYLTQLPLSRMESLAHLSAITLKEKFDHLTDLNISFVTRVQFRKLVKDGKWDEAVKIFQEVPQNFPFVDRVFLTDPTGTLMADMPSLSGVKGKNFSFRDWYKGVMETKKTYISELYKRTAEPQYNVIAIASPIEDENQNILGILVMQIRQDVLCDWAKETEVGPGGFVYFVDKNGHAVGHPKFPSQGEIVDFSSVSSAQKALKGEEGVEVLYNPIEKEELVTAYEPVQNYGWGVIVEQPVLITFAARNTHLQQDLIVFVIIVFIITTLAYFILHFINTLNLYRQQEKVFLESIGDGLVAIDRSWNITLWNKAASLLSGWSSEEVLGKPFRQILKFVFEGGLKENIKFIEDAMLYGEIHTMEDKTVLIRKDGREIPVADSASPIFDQSGIVSGAIIIFRDISKERELERAREEFSSLATHQLRAPVTVIKGYTEMLLEKTKIIKEDKAMLEKIYQAAQNMNDLANALLNVSRIELGTLAVNPEPAYLPDIANIVIEELLPEAKKKQIKIEKNYALEIPSINVDVKLSRAIFHNLLSNAIRYTPEKGRVNLEIRQEGSDILIKVSDTGYGIPKDQQSKVFSKFFRADNIRNKVPEGTGLGLYIVKSIVEQSGGKIWFESEENKGTTFYITIPLEGMTRREGIKGLT